MDSDPEQEFQRRREVIERICAGTAWARIGQWGAPESPYPPSQYDPARGDDLFEIDCPCTAHRVTLRLHISLEEAGYGWVLAEVNNHVCWVHPDCARALAGWQRAQRVCGSREHQSGLRISFVLYGREEYLAQHQSTWGMAVRLDDREGHRLTTAHLSNGESVLIQTTYAFASAPPCARLVANEEVRLAPDQMDELARAWLRYRVGEPQEGELRRN